MGNRLIKVILDIEVYFANGFVDEHDVEHPIEFGGVNGHMLAGKSFAK
jgi:hypothetical protein